MSVNVPIWLDVLEETARLCVVHGRNDLTGLVQQKRAQLLDPQLRVMLIGEPKKGKSQLINALLNAPVCPVGDAVTTAIPTIIKHAHSPYAELVHFSSGAADTGTRQKIAMDDVAAEVGGRNRRHGDGPVHVEIGVPRGLLANGMVLIDTPGVEDPDPLRLKEITELASADVVVMVSDATRELSVTELNLLLQLAQSHANLIVALTKIDMSPRWRDVAEQNRQQLAGLGVPATLIPVSATLRLQAARTNDHEINAESGFPALIARLTRDQSAKGDELARTGVHLLARTVIEQLAAPLRAELSNEDSATPASVALARLHEAQRAVDGLRRCSIRWQNTLNDDMADLMSDLEFDLRDRTRKILREVDEAFDQADPLTHWETFSQWLEENLIEAAEANYSWMLQRCDTITRRVADNFAAYGYGYESMPAWSVRVPDIADRVPEIEQPNIEKFTPTQKVFSGLRGSYGGVLMVGLATSLAGMPLINAVSIGAGAVFGGKTIFDESKSMLKRRQAAAKTASQRHVDDFFLRFHKDCRDSARNIQRMLRDHFAGLTEELQEAIVQSFRRAKQAADIDSEQRQRQVEQKMKQLAALYDQAQALVAGPGARTRARLEPRA